MIRDRGNIKWKTAFMLPEHMKKLNQFSESLNDVEKPEMTEDKMEEIHFILQEAIVEEKPVNLCYWNDKRLREITGFVKYEANHHRLRVHNEEDIITVSLNDIIGASF